MSLIARRRYNPASVQFPVTNDELGNVKNVHIRGPTLEFGDGAAATGTGSVAIGPSVTNAAASTVSLGSGSPFVHGTASGLFSISNENNVSTGATLAAAEMAPNAMVDVSAGGAGNVTLATAASLVAAFPGVEIGMGWVFFLNANAGGDITPLGNTGVTLDADSTGAITDGTGVAFLIRRTGAAAFSARVVAGAGGGGSTAVVIAGAGADSMTYLTGTATNNASVSLGHNADCTGDAAICIGESALASGTEAIAIGGDSGGVQAAAANATAAGAIAIGTNVDAGTANTICIGTGTDDNGVATGAVFIGNNANGFGTEAVAVGVAAQVDSAAGIAIGRGALVAAQEGIAIGGLSGGSGALANGARAIAIGRDANGSAADAICIGSSGTATGTSSTAVGPAAVASGDNSLACGTGAQATAESSVALGSAAQATASSCVALGPGVANSIASTVVLGSGQLYQRWDNIGFVTQSTSYATAVGVTASQFIIQTDTNSTMSAGTSNTFTINNGRISASCGVLLSAHGISNDGFPIQVSGGTRTAGSMTVAFWNPGTDSASSPEIHGHVMQGN